MAESEQTKVCPLCAETIKAVAKVCPHCRKYQYWWAFITTHDVLAVLPILILVWTAWALMEMFYSGRDFSSSRDKIEVLNSQLALDVTSYSTNVIVSGVLTNGSDYAWNIGEFEVRFFDDSGKLADADKASTIFTVLPHSNDSFKITLYSRNSIPKYASHKVLVQSAHDPNHYPLLGGN